MSDAPRILILGAGPCGLGAAWRLHEQGHGDWQLLEAAEEAGGLASSCVDGQGFVWDLGGHVVFSHYEYFDRVLDDLLGDQWVEHQRESWVWMRKRFIPYPLQNNIHRLPPEDREACVRGLLALDAGAGDPTPPANFGQWIDRAFGAGLAEVFMRPYNRKVWAYEPERLNARWVGERVAPVDVKRVLSNLAHQRDDVSWGPNTRFRFPLHGGTGAIWRALGQRLPSERLAFNTVVNRIDTRDRRVYARDGRSWGYDRLISTIPLDVLLRGLSDQPELSGSAGGLVHSSTHVVGLGLEGVLPAELATKCWMYFPEPEVPFYRVTVFSNYSPHNVPRPGVESSLMAEVSESPEKAVDSARVVDEVHEGLCRAGLVDRGMPVVSRWHRRLEHGYPTPFVGRDELLGRIDPALRALGIHSRGRFGGWKYEVSNQDHAFMQGVEAVDHLLHGEEERTYHQPEAVNRGKSPAPGR